ncbi:MAG: hypothetical protein K2J71_04090, partial [Oscillospiraceae bacterium]|nr:hypothetical protein [Oscillospiraceae bacterium]
MKDFPENLKNSKPRKKRKPGQFLGILLFLLVGIAVLLFLMSYLGKFGTGTGESGESGILIASGGISEAGADAESGNFQESGEISESETELETEPETQITILDITVMGSMYLYQNQEISLEDLLSEIQIQPDSAIVQIQDDNATQNAMEDLL